MRLKSVWIRHIAFPMMEKIKGNQIRRLLRSLEQSAKLPEKELLALQADALRKLLLHTIDHVPYYKPYAHLRDLIEQDPGAALQQFPVLAKETVRERFDELIADDVDKSTLILNRTGGSTGQPTMFYMDRFTVEHYEAARWRGLGWWGIQIGDPCVMVWGSPIELSRQQLKRQRWKDRLLKNQVFIPSFDLRKEKISEYLDLIDSYKPVYLFGWASALALFAEFMISHKRTLRHPLTAVLNTAETLYPHDRELIAKAFGCPVINEYGARDGGLLAYECPQGGMHLNIETAWIEAVDMSTKEPVATGEKGLIVVTDLHNFAMPRLRYLLGDVISLSDAHCACGRALPLIGSLDGRENDTFITADGAYINGQFFTNLARILPTVRQFQVIQKSRTEVVLRLLQHEGLAQADIDAFCEKITERMGTVHIKVELVPEIARQGSGKLRTAIREFAI
ncbi:MAG: phenylacetate--CoA ligase family protein [Firmicutes bacterium]|nr:phenylacetate--CoA ligase family protein [Bacillota bacterium]